MKNCDGGLENAVRIIFLITCLSFFLAVKWHASGFVPQFVIELACLPCRNHSYLKIF